MMADNAGSIREQDILDQASKLILTVKESYQNGTASHAIEKNIRNSMERGENDTLFPARKKIFNWLVQEQQQRNPSGKHPCILIMNGGKALWTMGETCLTGESIAEVLDLKYACSYVWKAVQALHPDKVVKNQVPIVKGYVKKVRCRDVNDASFMDLKLIA